MLSFASNFNELKIVVIENPYQNWENRKARDYFNKVIQLKKDCFGKYYKDPYAPVDKWDFCGTHTCLFHTVNGEELPLVALRSVTNEQCAKYGYKFSGRSIVEASGSLLHHRMLNEFIDGNIDNKIGLAGGLAFDIKTTPRNGLRRFMIDSFMPLYALNYMYQKWDAGVVIGITSSGLNKKYINNLGFELFKSNNETLAPIRIPTVGNVECEMMKMKKLKECAIDLAMDFMPLWESRVHIGDKYNELDASNFKGRLANAA